MRIIEISVRPFMPHPEVYMKYICENIIHEKYTEPIDKVFCLWTWKVNHYDEVVTGKIGDYLKSLYNQGLITDARW